MQTIFRQTDPVSPKNPEMARASATEPDFWALLKSKLREALDPEIFSTWIEPLVAHAITPNEYVVLVPNRVFNQRILDECQTHIEHCKSELGIDHILFRFEVDDTEAESSWKGALETSNPVFEEIPPRIEVGDTFPSTEHAPDANRGPSRSFTARAQLNPNYTFSSFVRGPSNEFALATCSAVAENPGKTYNPLFIYGSTGLGKTHLLHAVGNRVLERNPNANITYITSERFMNELVYCIRFNKMWEFRQKYRFCDLFLIDDIQFIAGKDRTQEEFFHTFNTLHAAKKQIVLTSDLFPQQIPNFEERLRNRFQWGLIADIQPPSLEHRMAILYDKADRLGVRISEDVILYIASHAKRHVRELEGALHRITAFAALHGRPISLELAAETLQTVMGDPPHRLSIDTIQKTVADHFKLRVSDLKSEKRQRTLTVPRQIAMYLSRTLTKASFPEIGERFGGKDHTTVMHAVKKIQKIRTSDLELKAIIETLERCLEQQS